MRLCSRRDGPLFALPDQSVLRAVPELARYLDSGIHHVYLTTYNHFTTF